ncbi:hypothetical protein [Vulgatibacter incomptus]|uniref:EF hand domain/PKD domain protein n=1 Tax=Vulgatibacter incomptus TaxID=1391653 RepID=A0A0K1P8C6_9BACT|nr:hypothetical protein [Vulgatibacter incomptus]AKU89778.1 EF hand domain/PKD domain protein [Vulgatibacter incomptus]
MRLEATWVILAVGLAAGCSRSELRTCSEADDCGVDAVCTEGFCLTDPAPRIVLAPERTRARLGEWVRIDGRASSIRGGEVELEFSADPADAVEITSSPEEKNVASMRFVRPHVDVEVTARALSKGGRAFEEKVSIASVNSPPRVSLRATPNPGRPGARIELVADATDPDGDALTYQWELVSGPGSLEASGDRAYLDTAIDRAEERYKVKVVVSDGLPDGSTTATVTVDSKTQAPEIVFGETPEVDHLCSGTPLTCAATAQLAPTVEDVGPLTYSWRLLGDGPVKATFDPEDGAAPAVTLSCSPACPIAGSHRVELAVSDMWGERATAEIEIRVLNRPPVLVAHGGAELPHLYLREGPEGASIFRVVRAPGSFVVYSDPDGDPPDPSSFVWSSTGPVVFGSASSRDPTVTAEGTAAQLRDLELTVVAADINGAIAADTRRVPIANQPPTVKFLDDSSAGHEHRDGIYRKRLDPAKLTASDPEGAPVTIVVELDPSDAAGLSRAASVILEDGAWTLKGPSSVVGYRYSLVARATDAWGATSEAKAKFNVTSRPPVLEVTNWPVKSFANWAESRMCCAVQELGGCRFSKSFSVGMFYNTIDGSHAAYTFRTSFVIRDPDGDPVELRLSQLEIGKNLLKASTSTGWRTVPLSGCPIGDCPPDPSVPRLVIPCGVGTEVSCRPQIALHAHLPEATSLDLRGPCVFPEASGVDGFARMEVRAADIFGTLSPVIEMKFETYSL